MTDLFDAIFGYYMLVLGAGAISGVRATMRAASAGPEGSASGDGSGSLGNDARAPLGERARTAGARGAEFARALRRSRRAGFIAGWASGTRVYRAGRTGGRAVTGRALERRTVRPAVSDGTAPSAPSPVAPDIATDGTPTPAAPTLDMPQTPEPAPADTGAEQTGPQPATGTTLDGDSADGLDAIARAITGPTPEFETPPLTSGRPRLTLVPPLKEYPEMPAADITDLESLLGFTGQAASTAGMESEDSIAASASTIAAAEFAGETARRVDEEIQTVEMAIATMSILNVDDETAAAYHRLHEAGGAYRELANGFAAACQDLAGIAANMATAASGYHEAAVVALDTVHTHQLPHAEAAQATGHGGADGQFYGVASTNGPALTPADRQSLPVGS